MAHHEFFFALDFSDEPQFDRMLALVSDAVLRYVGYDSDSAAAVTLELRAALAAGAVAGRRRCGVRFAAAFGALQISVSYAGGPTWETTCRLPAGS